MRCAGKTRQVTLLIGEEYKKPRGSYAEPIRSWYNRKVLAVECARDFGSELFDSSLADRLAAAYSRLMPLHDYFLEFYLSLGGDADVFR